MKNKRLKFDSKAKVSAPLNSTSNIKNLEQLRRKLKDLLEKDKSLACDVKKAKVAPGLIQTAKKISNVTNDQATQKISGIKKKKKDTSTDTALKRKSIDTQATYKENDTSSKKKSALQSTSSGLPAKKSKSNKISQKSNGVQKKAKILHPKKKTKKETLPVQPKAKIEKTSSLGSVQKQKQVKPKGPSLAKTQIEQNSYRGPLRPISPMSEEDSAQGEWNIEEESEVTNHLPSIKLTENDDFESQSDNTWNTADYDTESEPTISSDASIDDEDFSSSEFDYSSTDSQYDYESDSEGENFQGFSDGYSDSTYELPDGVPEDIYVAKGAAVKHDLSENNEIAFDSDDSCPQIIEITNKDKPQEIRNAITWNDEKKKPPEADEKTYDSADSCPELVPMDYESDIETDYDSDSCSDCIADKYFEHDHCEGKGKKIRMVPEIFKADKSVCTDVNSDLLNTSDPVPDHEVEGTPLERIANEKASKADYNVVTITNEKQQRFDEGRKVNGTVKGKIKDPSKDPTKHKKRVDANPKKVEKHALLNQTPCIPCETEKTKLTDALKDSTKNKKNVDPTSKEVEKQALLNQTTCIPSGSEKKKITDPLKDATKNKNSANATPQEIEKQEILNHTLSISENKDSDEESVQDLAENTLRNTDLDLSVKWSNGNQNNCSTASSQKESATRNDTFKNKTQFKTLFFNAINSNQVIVLLKDPLYLYGTLKLKLLAGGLDIFGYNPKPNEILEVFSPRGYSSLKIEPSTKIAKYPIENGFDQLTSNFLKNDVDSVRKNYNCKQDAIVILERNDNSKKVNMLRKYMVENLFPNMNLLQSDRPFYTSEFLLRCVLTPTADKPLIINPIWRTIPVTNMSKIMVVGGKSVGKSTLVRFLSNNYLNKGSKVLLIDLDIGQPEMFVPQTVSATTLTAPLLGPGYLSVKEPDKAFLVGHINVVLQPQRYIQSVHALISFCRENSEYKNIPWIVNTMGYNKGFGDEIIAAICSFLNPSNIVQLESRNEINNFDVIMSKENLQSMQCDIIGDMVCQSTDYHPNHVLSIMSSVASSNKKCQNDWELKPKDIRLAMIISRLSAVLKGQAEWLADVKPVCASTNDLKLVSLGDEDLSTEDLIKGLVGNLVYLCKHNSNGLNECLGIGIVRGIDFPLKQIYLLPAIPINLLEDVNCLAICGIPLPSSILINQGPKVKGVVSYIYNTIDRAASMHIKQMYNRPEHFLTGKFKTTADL